MKKLFVAMGYVSMLGPPHAIRLHAEAQGTGGELDGVPVWMAVAAEYTVRAGIFLVVAWIFQSSMTSEDFRRFQVASLLVAVYATGTVHTLIYAYCFARMRRRWARSKVLIFYRIGRNLVYSIIPAFLTTGLVLKWQDFNQMPLFQGNIVQLVFFGTWCVVALLGLLEALLMRRMPVGISSAIAPVRSSSMSQPKAL